MEDYRIIEAMKKYGGGFVKALANAASLADAENLRKLKSAFQDYWDEYSIIAEGDG